LKLSWSQLIIEEVEDTRSFELEKKL